MTKGIRMGLIASAFLAAALATSAADAPVAREGDFVMRDFRFSTGETLPELRIHYHAFGQPRKDSQGVVRNAVLIMHGTGIAGGILAISSIVVGASMKTTSAPALA